MRENDRCETNDQAGVCSLRLVFTVQDQHMSVCLPPTPTPHPPVPASGWRRSFLCTDAHTKQPGAGSHSRSYHRGQRGSVPAFTAHHPLGVALPPAPVPQQPFTSVMPDICFPIFSLFGKKR